MSDGKPAPQETPTTFVTACSGQPNEQSGTNSNPQQNLHPTAEIVNILASTQNSQPYQPKNSTENDEYSSSYYYSSSDEQPKIENKTPTNSNSKTKTQGTSPINSSQPVPLKAPLPLPKNVFRAPKNQGQKQHQNISTTKSVNKYQKTNPISNNRRQVKNNSLPLIQPTAADSNQQKRTTKNTIVKRQASRPASQNSRSRPSDPSEIISIDNYDPYNPKPINDPESLYLLNSLGIDASELAMPSENDIKKINDEELQEIFVDHHKKRIGRLFEQVKTHRSILANKGTSRTTSRLSTARSVTQRDANLTGQQPHDDPSLEIEKKQFEKIQQKHRRDVEQLVTTVLTQEKMRQDMARREERDREMQMMRKQEKEAKMEQARIKYERKLQEHAAAEAELARQNEEFRQRQYEKDQQRILTLKRQAEEKLQKMREYEEMRLQRLQKNRDNLEKMQEDRLVRIRQREMDNQEKEIAYLERKHQENAERNEKAQSEFERKEKLLHTIRDNEEKDHEALKIYQQNKEIENEQKYEDFTRRRKEEREMARMRHDEKIKRYNEKKEQLEQEKYQKRVKLATSEEYMTQRVAFVEQQKEKERQKKAFIYQLKKEERDQNALHIQRIKENKQRSLEQKLANKQQQLDNFEQEKQAFYKKRTEALVNMERDRKQINAEFAQQISDNSLSADNVVKIATKYGVDMNSIYMKLNNNAAVSRPISRASTRSIRVTRSEAPPK